MDFWIAAIIITSIGCGTGIVVTFIDKVFDSKKKTQLKAAEQELRLTRDRAQQQELRIVELNRQNDQLHKQVEWHAKLLETQDRLLKQLGSGEAAHALGDRTSERTRTDESATTAR